MNGSMTLFNPSPENSSFKFVITHAKPSTAMAARIIRPVEADLKKIASRVLEKAQEICSAKLVKDVIIEVVEGDPMNFLCETVEKHHTSMLVVDSHGDGAIKRAVMGSVSDYCAHHAHCSVVIVKRPKDKN